MLINSLPIHNKDKVIEEAQAMIFLSRYWVSVIILVFAPSYAATWETDLALSTETNQANKSDKHTILQFIWVFSAMFFLP